AAPSPSDQSASCATAFALPGRNSRCDCAMTIMARFRRLASSRTPGPPIRPLREWKVPMRNAAACCLSWIILAASVATAGDGNRLAYLDESDPFYVSRGFPKLVTPQWIGEEGVEAVVVLAIDDMREIDKWEIYLRPILERLKKIDGRAPVSIM